MPRTRQVGRRLNGDSLAEIPHRTVAAYLRVGLRRGEASPDPWPRQAPHRGGRPTLAVTTPVTAQNLLYWGVSGPTRPVTTPRTKRNLLSWGVSRSTRILALPGVNRCH